MLCSLSIHSCDSWCIGITSSLHVFFCAASRCHAQTATSICSFVVVCHRKGEGSGGRDSKCSDLSVRLGTWLVRSVYVSVISTGETRADSWNIATTHPPSSIHKPNTYIPSIELHSNIQNSDIPFSTEVVILLVVVLGFYLHAKVLGEVHSLIAF